MNSKWLSIAISIASLSVTIWCASENDVAGALAGSFATGVWVMCAINDWSGL
jgi:hypothetical protein